MCLVSIRTGLGLEQHHNVDHDFLSYTMQWSPKAARQTLNTFCVGATTIMLLVCLVRIPLPTLAIGASVFAVYRYHLKKEIHG